MVPVCDRRAIYKEPEIVFEQNRQTFTSKKTLMSSSIRWYQPRPLRIILQSMLTCPRLINIILYSKLNMSVSYSVSMQRQGPRICVRYEVLRAYMSASDYYGLLQRIMTPVQCTCIYLVKKTRNEVGPFLTAALAPQTPGRTPASRRSRLLHAQAGLAWATTPRFSASHTPPRLPRHSPPCTVLQQL